MYRRKFKTRPVRWRSHLILSADSIVTDLSLLPSYNDAGDHVDPALAQMSCTQVCMAYRLMDCDCRSSADAKPL